MTKKKKYRVLVRLKPDVLDVQGKAVQKSLEQNGYAGLSEIRVGKVIEFYFEAENSEQQASSLESVCSQIFANTVIEDYEIEEIE